MESEEPKLPAVRSIAWLGLGVFTKLSIECEIHLPVEPTVFGSAAVYNNRLGHIGGKEQIYLAAMRPNAPENEVPARHAWYRRYEKVSLRLRNESTDFGIGLNLRIAVASP
jgi:hypothetical protein